jgi:hypothetical protein
MLETTGSTPWFRTVEIHTLETAARRNEKLTSPSGRIATRAHTVAEISARSAGYVSGS